MPGNEARIRDDALRGTPRPLLVYLTPVIQARVARALLSHGRARHLRSVRQEVEDLTQEVLVSLFEHDAMVLRSWSPERGMSLKNFVGMIATRRTIDILRTARRNPWTEEATEDLAPLLPQGARAEQQAATRQLLERVIEALRADLSAQGQRMLQLILLEDRSNEEITALTGLNAAAIYKWRSRLRKAAREQRSRLLSEGAQAAEEIAR